LPREAERKLYLRSSPPAALLLDCSSRDICWAVDAALAERKREFARMTEAR
jgi:hypothetical protein